MITNEAAIQVKACPGSPTGAHRWDIDNHHHGRCLNPGCTAGYDFSPIADPFGRDKLKPVDRQIIQATKLERWRETLKGKQEAKEVLEKVNSTGTQEKPYLTVTPPLTPMTVETQNPDMEKAGMAVHILDKEPDRKKDFNGWLDFHKTELTKDYQEMPQAGFRLKWKMNGVQTKGFRKYFALPTNDRQKLRKKRDAAHTPKLSSAIKQFEELTKMKAEFSELRVLTTRLTTLLENQPKMPAWQEAWGDDVKVQWLVTLGVLRRDGQNTDHR